MAMAASFSSKSFLGLTISLTIAGLSATAAVSVYILRRKTQNLKSEIAQLEASLNSSVQKCAAERQGRIRAQQALRASISRPVCDDLESTSYPMTPIGIVKSCFSTRNGTPRQPLLVPMARACLVFSASRVPPASLEGLGGYSHCWILYVFHLNTDLEKLWMHPSRSKVKAKVRVPRLKGGRVGVFATRSPHRPCPIGLTVAKVEEVQGNMVFLSGVDLVDGTPVLDIKPYLPYCDSIQGASVPAWVTADTALTVASVTFSEVFSSALADCWAMAQKRSLYGSADELQTLITQVLSWDIRSVSQRNRPHDNLMKVNRCDSDISERAPDIDHVLDEENSDGREQVYPDSSCVIYHLVLEGLDISYRIDFGGNVFVENVTFSPDVLKSKPSNVITEDGDADSGC